MSKKKIFAIVLFIFIGLFMFAFANPSGNKNEDLEIELKKDTEEIVKKVKIDVDIKTEKEISKITYNKGTKCENGTEIENGSFEVTSNGTYIVCVETSDEEVESKTIEITNIDNTRPRISVEPAVVKLLLGTDYDVMTGVTATDNNGTPELEASLTDTTTLELGSHTVTYTATDKAKNTATAERTIKIYDPSGDEDNDGFVNQEEIENGTDPDDENSHGETITPVINVKDLTIEVFDAFLEDATATLDSHDTITDPTKFTVTGEINTNKLGIYTLEYSITDRYGKTGTATRTITVVDTVKPIINLKNTKLEINSKDTLDPMVGVSATDNYDGDITSNIVVTKSDVVNGKYTITYAVKDSSNNIATPVVADVTIIYNIIATSNVDGNEINVIKTAKAGDKVDFSTSLATGYEIDNIKLNGETITETSFTMPDKNVTIDLTVKKINYSITVNETENGVVTSDKKVATMGDTVTLTINPSTGHSLNKLTVKDAEGNDIEVTNNTFTMPASNVTISATFKANTYTATFKIDGEVCGTSDTVFGETITVPSTCVTTKTGHSFSGWDKTLTMDTEGKEINGKFTKNTYTATFKIDGKVCGTSDAVFNGTITIPTTCTAAEGYHLNDWDKTLTMDTEGKTLLTNSVKNNYTVTITDTTNGAVVTNKNVANINDEIKITTTPSVGYEVDTITVKDANNNDITVDNKKFTMPASNVIVTVTFKKTNYTITVERTSNGTVSVNKSSANINDEIAITISPATGYVLNNLTVKDASNNDITVDNKKFTMPASNVIVSATFKKGTYTATFKIDDKVCGTKNVEFGKTITVPSTCVTTKTGHSFSGWDETLIMNAEGKEINGKFTKNTYTATFKIDDKVCGTSDAVFDGTITVPSTCVTTKTGHSFSDWDKTLTMDAEGKEINGKFTKNTYTATFKIDGKVCGTKDVEYDGTFTKPEGCTAAEGYHLNANWNGTFKMDDINGKTYSTTSSINVYDVKFYNGNTQLGATQNIEHGKDAVAPAAPSKTGFVFTGWDKTFTNVTQNLTVKATYNVKKINVYFKHNISDITPMETHEVEYNTKTTSPSAKPTKDSDANYIYDFEYWYLSTDADKKGFSFDTLITEEIVLLPYFSSVKKADFIDQETPFVLVEIDTRWLDARLKKEYMNFNSNTTTDYYKKNQRNLSCDIIYLYKENNKYYRYTDKELSIKDNQVSRNNSYFYYTYECTTTTTEITPIITPITVRYSNSEVLGSYADETKLTQYRNLKQAFSYFADDSITKYNNGTGFHYHVTEKEVFNNNYSANTVGDLKQYKFVYFEYTEGSTKYILVYQKGNGEYTLVRRHKIAQ